MNARVRWLVSLVVIVAAAAALILLTQGSGGVKVSDYGSGLPTVLISSIDISKGQALDPLIEEGVFSEFQVPHDALIDGAVTDLDQLRGMTALSDIPRDHQISANHVEPLDEGPA